MPRKGENGYKLPEPIPSDEIFTDLEKRKWKLGKSIGLGGFGEIYLCTDKIDRAVGANADYVIKVEPHSNGPLFVEIHFYCRVGKHELIEQWMKKKKLNVLGMPRFVSWGSHDFKGTKYRFLVMDRFGEDLQKVLERNKKSFPLKTVYSLGIKIIDILEYIHSHGFIHGDIKASNLLLGYGLGNENQVYLVDFGLACKYIQNDGKHKEYKEDLRKAHNGTIEFTSRDAHIGADSRRGDLEILGYNMLQWSCSRLPWENNLKNVTYVSQSKHEFMANIPESIRRCFPRNATPEGLEKYFQYIAGLQFDEEPNYDYIKNVLINAVRKIGCRNDGKLIFTKPPKVNNKSPPKTPTKSLPHSPKYKKDHNKKLKSPKPKKRETCSSPNTETSLKYSEISNDASLDNPTPAMLLVMKKKMEKTLNNKTTNSVSYDQERKRTAHESVNSSQSSDQKESTRKVRRKNANQRSPGSNRKSFSPQF